MIRQLYFKIDKELLFFIIKFILYEYLRRIRKKIAERKIHPEVLKNIVYVSEYYEEFDKKWLNKDKAMKVIFGV